MKQKIKLCLNWLLICPLLNFGQTQINPLIMGQNYHVTTFSNVPASSTPLSSGVWSNVTASGTILMRSGGYDYNVGTGSKPPQNAAVYYVRIVDDARAHGCEPVITIPFSLNKIVPPATGAEPNAGSTDYINAVSTATTLAKEIIRLVNIVHRRNVKYVIIANEPDIDYDWKPSQSMNVAQQAENIATYVREISKAVKEVDPSIKIIGPELSFYYPALYQELFFSGTSANRIDGLIPSGTAAGLPYIDFVSCHLYLYNFYDLNNSTSIAPNQNPNLIEPSGSTWNRDMIYTEPDKYIRHQTDNSCCGKRPRGVMREMQKLCASVYVIQSKSIKSL